MLNVDAASLAPAGAGGKALRRTRLPVESDTTTADLPELRMDKEAVVLLIIHLAVQSTCQTTAAVSDESSPVVGLPPTQPDKSIASFCLKNTADQH